MRGKEEDEEEEEEEGRVEFTEKKAREGGREGDEGEDEEKRECVRFLYEASRPGKRARRVESSVPSLLLGGGLGVR